MKQLVLILVAFILCSTAVISQCNTYRHSTNWFDGWTSCAVAQNPNVQYAETHWMMYDLGNLFDIKQSHFWNHNEPSNLGIGIKRLAVDFSSDGINWINGGIVDLPMADGTSVYEGVEGIDFTGAQAQYILFTALETHGNNCAGLAEIKIEASPTVSSVLDQEQNNSCLTVNVFPNPISTQSRAYLSGACIDNLNYEIINLLGERIQFGQINDGENYFLLNLKELQAGEYILSVYNDQEKTHKKILKL